MTSLPLGTEIASESGPALSKINEFTAGWAIWVLSIAAHPTDANLPRMPDGVGSKNTGGSS